MDINELRKVTYLNPDVIGGRSVLLMPFWDGTEWHQWIDTPNGLIEMKVVDTIRSNYVSKAAVTESDIWIPFVDLMWQRASWPDITRFIFGICDDFHAMATSAAKLRHYHVARESIPPNLASSFVATELEYLVTVARSVFDLLQEMIATVWNTRVRLLDEPQERIRRSRPIPPGFTKMAVVGRDSPRAAVDLSLQHAIPSALAEAYAGHAPFFISLLKTRDRIVHGGTSVQSVFVTEKGFCVDPKQRPFSDAAWTEAHHYNENIASLLPWVAHIVFGTIDACNNLAGTFASVVSLPDEIAPGHRVFIRDPANPALIELQRVANGDGAWWKDRATDIIHDHAIEARQRPSV